METAYITDITKTEGYQHMSNREQEKIEEVCTRFPFKASSYYLSHINWENPSDPFRKIIFPDFDELDIRGYKDPSREQDYTVKPGVQHKYNQTALLLMSDVCGGICRFCFRKRLFMDCKRETIKDCSEGLEYIRENPQITNVLLTGGDPLVLPTSRLRSVIKELREISHVQIIRIGTKMPAYNPERIIHDNELFDLIREYSNPEKKIYFMVHFNHPAELTDIAKEAISSLQKAGAVVVHQTPVISGLNNDPETLSNLFRNLSFAGVSPYYVFQCRPTIGNRMFSVPVERSYEIVQEAFQRCSGLAKRARFIMSHSSGKIEVVGMNEMNIYMRYHQAASDEDIGKFFEFPKNPTALWFDDYLSGKTV